MFASKMMDSRVHISDGTTGGMPSGKSNNNHLFGHAIAEDLVRRYFSRSLDPKDKIGLPGFGMQALCLPPEKRVFKLCYTIELMAVIAGGGVLQCLLASIRCHLNLGHHGRILRQRFADV